MTALPSTATEHQSIAARQGAFSDALSEPEYGVVRRQLGLRPNAYSDSNDERHPDRRLCPSWCWVGQSGGEYDHEVESAHPMSATHTLEGFPHVVASLYQGHSVPSSEGRSVQAATIESHLEQLGQEAPIIRVNLRHWEGREQQYGEILKLTLTDAQELATALTYLIETAEN